MINWYFDDDGFIHTHTCQCGHESIDHDWWGHGDCGIDECQCQKFKDLSPEKWNTANLNNTQKES